MNVFIKSTMKNVPILLLLLNKGLLIEANKKERGFNLNQHDYQLKYERVELVRYNKDYVEAMSVITNKYNRTQAVSNITYTFKVDLGNDLVWVLQAYKFMSNEYRFFPLHFGFKFCEGIAANAGGLRKITSCGNFTGCPLVKGRKYHMCNFYPDQAQLPPFIPNGDYKVEFQAMYLSTEIYVVQGYASVTRPTVKN